MKTEMKPIPVEKRLIELKEQIEESEANLEMAQREVNGLLQLIVHARKATKKIKKLYKT